MVSREVKTSKNGYGKNTYLILFTQFNTFLHKLALCLMERVSLEHNLGKRYLKLTFKK